MKILINLPNLIFLLLLFSCTNAGQQTTIINSSKKIIEYQVNVTDFDMEHVFTITCENFEKILKGEIESSIVIESSTVKDTVKIEKLQEILKDLKEDPEKYHPDVRGQLLVKYSDGTIVTLCLSWLGLELNGIPMIYDDRILQLIDV